MLGLSQIWRLMIVTFSIMLLVNQSYSRSLRSGPAEDWVGMADQVFMVEITHSEAINSGQISCGVRYFATIIKRVKGTTDLSRIEFGFGEGLDIGTKYNIYLVGKHNSSRLRDFVSAVRSSSDTNLFLAACSDAIPDLFMFGAGLLD
jgi:hypothetical protein